MEEIVNTIDWVSPYDYLTLPLYPDPDYIYTVAIERIAYRIRLCFNIRSQSWSMDIRYASGDPVALGVSLVPNYPVLIDHEMPFSGFFYLESKGKEANETVNNPFEIWKYYNFYYGYERVG